MDERRRTAWLLAVALLAPLFAMAVVPFQDNSEPRYAEIARLMVQSGDWITPWFAPDVPFWGKPPLSFWAQALAIQGFGLSEFALRLPSWLCWLAINAVLWAGVRRVHGAPVALWTLLVYDTCALVSLCAGAVLTDPFLALGTTVSLVSFAVVVSGVVSDAASRVRTGWFWRYGVFVGIAIGLLAKGPLAVVLCAAPALAWIGVQRWRQRPQAAWAHLPWGRGLLLCAVLSLPWYALAEWKTPGFLQYFLIGEHVLRFVDAGWSGDLYGTAHRQAWGTIWLYWLIASFPWGVLVLGALAAGACRARLRQRLSTALAPIEQDPLFSLWLAGAVCAPALFTLSANILWTYCLPALAGFSVLAAQGIVACTPHCRRLLRVVQTAAAVIPAVVLGWALWAGANPEQGKTERGLVRYAQQSPELPLWYLGDPPFSARFYARGQVQGVSGAQLPAAIASAAQRPFWLAVPQAQSQGIQTQLGAVDVHYRNRRYVLLRVPPPAAK